MRILMLYPFDIYKSDSPGVERIIAFATKLVRQRHQVKLVYYYDPSVMEVEGVEHKDRFIFTAIPYVRYHRTLVSKIRNITAIAKSADIIHFQTLLPEIALPALFAGYAIGRPLHYDYVDYGMNGAGYSGRFLNSMRKNLLKLVDTVSVADEDSARYVLSQGFKEFKLFNLPDNSFDKDDESEFPLNHAYALLLGQSS